MKMRVSISLLFFSFLISAIGQQKYARLEKLEKVDSCGFECIYYHLIEDPIANSRHVEDDILQIGESVCKYWSYGKYQIDSVVSEMGGRVTNSQYHDIFRKYKSEHCHILKEKSNIRVFDRVFIDYYVYTEPTPAIKWNFVKGTDVVCGYKCKKATATFRGRNWTAWYAPEIPYMEGPWKFNGLPGLILRIEDDKNEHVFEATSIRMANSPITKVLKDYIPTTRENFNKALSEYKSDPSTVLGASELAPKDANGKPIPLPKRRMFYNPIELE